MEQAVDSLLNPMKEGHSLISSGLDYLAAHRGEEARRDFEGAIRALSALQSRHADLKVIDTAKELHEASTRSIAAFLEAAELFRDIATDRGAGYANKLERATAKHAEGVEYFKRAGDIARHVRDSTP